MGSGSLKLEREVYGIKRPHQLAARDVFIRIGEPVDLSTFIAEYMADSHSVRHKLAKQLRQSIQSLIDEIILTHVNREPQEEADKTNDV